MIQNFIFFLPLLNNLIQHHFINFNHFPFLNVPIHPLIKVDHYYNRLDGKFQLNPTCKIYHKKVWLNEGSKLIVKLISP